MLFLPQPFWPHHLFLRYVNIHVYFMGFVLTTLVLHSETVRGLQIAHNGNFYMVLLWAPMQIKLFMSRNSDKTHQNDRAQTA